MTILEKRKIRAQRSRSFRCPHCGAAMILRPASEIYHDAKSDRKLYVCHNYPACNTYVAAHPNTDKPMGVPANGDLRNLRIQAHRKFDLMIGISKRLLLIPVLHPKFSVRNPSEPLATCILTMRMSLKSSGNIAAAELSIRQPKSWTCAFLSMASRETRAAKKTAIRLFCEEGSLWNML